MSEDETSLKACNLLFHVLMLTPSDKEIKRERERERERERGEIEETFEASLKCLGCTGALLVALVLTRLAYSVERRNCQTLVHNGLGFISVLGGITVAP